MSPDELELALAKMASDLVVQRAFLDSLVASVRDSEQKLSEKVSAHAEHMRRKLDDYGEKVRELEKGQDELAAEIKSLKIMLTDMLMQGGPASNAPPQWVLGLWVMGSVSAALILNRIFS